MSTETLVSWAQNREDILLWRALCHVTEGTYVDVGAADPVEDSVTKLFYDRGWSGLNVEPVPAFADRLREERERDVTVQACAGSSPGSATLHLVPETGLSSLDADAAAKAKASGREIVDTVVDVRTLDQLLDDAGLRDRDIHFLKIDVEGFEREVLQGLDRSVWRPWVIVVEATAPNSTDQVHGAWEPDLLASEYEFCVFDGLNRFYVAREHDDLGSRLAYPVCSLDPPFVTAPHHRVLAAYDKLLASTHNLEAELVRTQNSYQQQEQAHADLRSGYERLTAIHHAALASYELQAGELAKTVSSYEVQVREVERLTKTNGELTDECATLRHGVVDMAGEIDDLRQALLHRESMAEALDQVMNSTSWRLTRPVRKVADVAKRWRRNTAP